MIIKEYLDKIETLQNKKTQIAFLDNADLELCIQKIEQSRAKLSFTFDALLNKETPENIVLNTDIIKSFSDHLGLLFLEEESGNVCFANSDDLRSEYRQSFKLIDFLDYLYAFMHSSVFTASQKIMLTSETDLFWKLAKIGSSLRKQII